jgi:small subunit ribosomal protein S9
MAELEDRDLSPDEREQGPAEPADQAPADGQPAGEAPPGLEEAEAGEAAAPEAPAEAAVEAPAESAPEAPEDAAPEAPEGAAPEAERAEAEAEPARTLVELAADARYIATGKRKSAVARVILKPGTGRFNLNGRPLETYFPRATHRAVVQQPLAVTGYTDRVDVRARIHGGGVSGQADALRHGIARALIEADPALRGELKRRQLLTRDPRVKERRKAGLKKARKRPQFSKR